MAKRVSTPSPAAKEAVEAFRLAQFGKLTEIGSKLGVTKQAISGWHAVPAEWVRQLADITGIPPWRLRPDLYDAPPTETVDAAGP